jgi:hypothetical protein
MQPERPMPGSRDPVTKPHTYADERSLHSHNIHSLILSSN